MKNALMILSALAATSVFAVTEVQSENTFGFVETAGGNGTTRSLIMVAVPVAGYGNTSSEISIADILQTSNLATGDELYTLADGGKYNKYTLNSDKTAWTPAKTVTIGADGTATATGTDSAETATIARGQAFWLNTAAENVYLMGEATTDAGSISISEGWNLIGNPSMTAALKVSGINAGKGSRLNVGSTYYQKGKSGWYRLPEYSAVADTDVIAVGQGAMLLKK